MKWVLILMIYTLAPNDLANSPSVAVTTIEFSSEDACYKASRSLESFEKSSSPRKVIDAACLPK